MSIDGYMFNFYFKLKMGTLALVRGFDCFVGNLYTQSDEDYWWGIKRLCRYPLDQTDGFKVFLCTYGLSKVSLAVGRVLN